jgi:hypothetical protein
VRGRRVHQAVHLDTRCDGSAHGGCQAGCLIFWKEAWLKPLGTSSQIDSSVNKSFRPNGSQIHPATGCSEAEVVGATKAPSRPGEATTYVCQATRLPYATTRLEWWEFSQYIEDYRSGNVSFGRLLGGGVYFFYLWLSNAGISLGRPMRWFYDRFCFLWGGVSFPRRNGTVPAGESTPVQTLNVQPGELVRIKPYNEILKTLNDQNRNRGLYFDAEEVPYCGKTYRVLRRVEKIINERTGHMLEMKTPCVILDSVVCESRYSECRLFCPRSIYAYWREIWLERVSPDSAVSEEPQHQEFAAQSK